MCTAVSFVQGGDLYFGRTLDLDRSFGEQVVVVPRNYSLRFRMSGALDSHYAMIGMALVREDYPLYYEAANEAGLAMAGLNFPGNARYAAPAGGRDNVASFEFLPWMLGQCADVDQAEGLLARLNINLRCGERVLLRLAAFHAFTFDDLFEGAKAIPWQDYLQQDSAFPVTGYCVNSQLHSVPDCQRIIKKAAVDKMKQAYAVGWFPEEGVKYQIRFALMNDEAEIYLDLTGAPLYKRGYRLATQQAPLRETLAASLVKIARYRGQEELIDPFCGSGTIAIEYRPRRPPQL